MSKILTGSTKINLAYISPVNPTPNGLSDYSETLLPVLSERAQITLYTDSGTPANRLIADRFVTRAVQSLLRHRAEHDLCLYQLGNSADHQAAFDSLRRVPGVVTLHEPFLHTGIRAISTAHYCRELKYDLGGFGSAIAKWSLFENDRSRLLDYPLIGRVLDLSLGIIVHSQAARQMIDRYRIARPTHWHHFGTASPVAVIPQLMPLAPLETRAEPRSEFGLPDEAFILGVVGLFDPTKEPELILQAFAHVVSALPHARLVFAGELPTWYTRLPDLARELHIAPYVVFLGRVEPLDRLHQAIAACDVIVGLRRPTIGETSAAALRAMAMGRPLIVRDVGWYGELPAAATIKISPTGEEEELAQVMLQLARSTELRQQMGDAARRFVQTECDAATVARRYVEFLQEVMDRIWYSLVPSHPAL